MGSHRVRHDWSDLAAAATFKPVASPPWSPVHIAQASGISGRSVLIPASLLCLTSWLEQFSLKYLLPRPVWYHFLLVPLLLKFSFSSNGDFLHSFNPLNSRDIDWDPSQAPLSSSHSSWATSLIASMHWRISTPSTWNSFPSSKSGCALPRHFYQALSTEGELVFIGASGT